MFSLHLLNFRLYGIGRKGFLQPGLIKNMASEYVWRPQKLQQPGCAKIAFTKILCPGIFPLKYSGRLL